jgi:hypothetical protein
MDTKNLEYVLIRTCNAGVFTGYLHSKENMQVTLLNARRIWYWAGAASLSQLAMDGVSKPRECKFPCEVDRIILSEVIEIINVTEKAKKCIAEVPVWHE